MKHRFSFAIFAPALLATSVAAAQPETQDEPSPEPATDESEKEADSHSEHPPAPDGGPGLSDVEPDLEEGPDPSEAEVQQPEAPEAPPRAPRRKPARPAIDFEALHGVPAPCPDAIEPGSPNLAPSWNHDGGHMVAFADELFTFEPAAYDPEGKKVTYKVITLPPRAQVKWTVDRYYPCDDESREPNVSMSPRIVWTPTREDSGNAKIILEASDGTDTSRLEATLDVEYNESAIFLPGASYSVYAPKGHSDLYHGPSFELLLGGWINEDAEGGPGIGRIYTSIGMLRGENLADAVQFNFGFDLSFEGHPRRSFLIPYFGLETGGFFRQTGANVGHFTPTLGMHVIATRNIFLNVMGGHLFPTARIDELPGYIGRASLNLAFW